MRHYNLFRRTLFASGRAWKSSSTPSRAQYVFFKSFTFTQIFNKLDIQTTYMYIYSSSISLVTHSLIHTLNQAIMHTYVTLEPQIDGTESHLSNLFTFEFSCSWSWFGSFNTYDERSQCWYAHWVGKDITGGGSDTNLSKNRGVGRSSVSNVVTSIHS